MASEASVGHFGVSVFQHCIAPDGIEVMKAGMVGFSRLVLNTGLKYRINLFNLYIRKSRDATKVQT